MILIKRDVVSIYEVVGTSSLGAQKEGPPFPLPVYVTH